MLRGRRGIGWFVIGWAGVAGAITLILWLVWLLSGTV